MQRPDGFRAHWLKPLVGNRVPNRFVFVDAVYLESASDEDPGAIQLGLNTFASCLVTRTNETLTTQMPRFNHSVPESLEQLWDDCSASRCTWIVGYRIARLLEVIDWWREIDRGYLQPMEPDDHCDGRQAYDIPVGGNGYHVGTYDHTGNCCCASQYRQCPLRPMVTADPPTILGAVWRGRRCLFVDSRNYWPEDPDEMAEHWLQTVALRPLPGASTVSVRLSLSERIDGLRQQWVSTIEQWRSHSNATWQPTAAGLAWAHYRANFLQPKTVLVHDSADALTLERLGYYGGQVFCGYVGKVMAEDCSEPPPPRSLTLQTHTVPGGLTETDVCSLYPAMFGSTVVPTVHRGDRWGDFCLDRLQQTAATWGAAHVRIRTDKPSYPCRVDYHTGKTLIGPYHLDDDRLLQRPHRTVYPIGEFDTVLCGVDLTTALSRGNVVCVYRWSEYEADVIGTHWLNSIWQLRMQMRDAQDKIGEGLVKLLMNGLMGKWAATRSEWQDCPGVYWPRPWDAWLRFDVSRGLIQNCRTISGLVQRQVERGEAGDSCPAIAAAITAAGRQRMRWYRSLLPERSVYYQDTDSLWIRRDCDSLVLSGHEEDQHRPGTLRLVDHHKRAAFLGTRCYWSDKGWTVAGLARWNGNAVDDEWIQEVCDGAGTVIHRGPGKGVRKRRSIRRPRVVEIGRSVGPDGWTAPYELSPVK